MGRRPGIATERLRLVNKRLEEAGDQDTINESLPI